MLEQADDHAGLVHVWLARGSVANGRQDFQEWARAAEEALRHSRLAGQRRVGLFYLEMALVHGPRPADEALETLDRLVPEAPDAFPLGARAMLLAMLGRFEEAWPVARRSNEPFREQGSGWGEERMATVASLAGDHKTASLHRRALCDWMEERDLFGFLSTYAPLLGRTLCALGRFEEAEPFAHQGRELGDEQDWMTQSLWRQVLALVMSHRGEHAEAASLAREAVRIAGQTESLNSQGDALCDLAEVLAAAGRTDEAAEVLEQALDAYERKRNLAMVAQVRPQLHEFRKRRPAAGRPTRTS